MNSETAPADWAPTQAVPEPIINSPYTEPARHWVYRDGTPYRMDGRRRASYFYKTRQVGSRQQEFDLMRSENEDDLPLVNALRADVRRWRQSDYRGASNVTKDLLHWWLAPDRPRRLFFCQQEAVETIVYLLEMGIPGRLRSTGFQNFELDAKNIDLLLRGERPLFENLPEDFWPRHVDAPSDSGMLPLRRLGCKMATGSGKTVVMAMLIAWAFCNRGKNPGSQQYPHGILICAPNLTVKKRLQVLRPEDPDNYYDAFDLVPPKYRELMTCGKVFVTNWHFFAPKSEHVEGGKSYAVVNKGKETDDAFTLDRLGELASRLPILVLNDEGHHCWRGKPMDEKEEAKLLKGDSREETAAIKEEAAEARVWLAGLDRINNCALIGHASDGRPNPGILACVDLSATPFYLGASGYPEGSPFPWIVSNFGLVDAIECGITKVPRLPVKDEQGKTDDAGRPDPRYFRLWEHIKDDLKEGDYIRRGQPKPEAIYKYAEGALQMLAGQWKAQFDSYKADADGNSFIPPVLIVVCDNTDQAEVFFRRISGEDEVETTDDDGKTVTVPRYGAGTILPEFANTDTARHTIRIDSKLLAKIETEEGETKDQAALRLREIIDTVGKRGGIGEQVRCVVSVSMLTEGWDASNVTHVLGVRAFGSQLLCEQVVGRGLRRMDYNPDPETGMLQAEYVDVFGIPFSLIPFKGKPKDQDPKPDPVYHDIYAMEERAEFEVRMPNVESYVYSIREGGIRFDLDKAEGFIVQHEPAKVFLAPTKGYQDDTATVRDSGDWVKVTREQYYKTVRFQQVLFRLTQLIVDDLLAGVHADKNEGGRLKLKARHQLFPEVFQMVRTYVAQKVRFAPGVDQREIGMERYMMLLRGRVRDNILSTDSREHAKLLPVLNSYEPYTTTANVNYKTTRPVQSLVKSHLNAAMLQSSWERRAIETMELTDCVECFTPNDRQIGLIVPYEYEGAPRNYEPDFVVRLQNGLMVLLEIKGEGGKIHGEDQVLAKNAAAKKWVTAVNNLGRHGDWVFEICEDLDELRPMLERHAGVTDSTRPFRFVSPTPDTVWQRCVPLITLEAAAGHWSGEQEVLDQDGEFFQDWIEWDGSPRFEKGMFVARILGKSMEPDIPDGAYALFRRPRAGSRQGRTLFLWHEGITDPHTGGRYTVKIYESEKRGSEDGEWQHARIILKPRNPDYTPIVLEPEEEGEVRVIGEFVQVVGVVDNTLGHDTPS